MRTRSGGNRRLGTATVALLAVAAVAAPAAGAAGGSVGNLPAPNGVAVDGEPYRYYAEPRGDGSVLRRVETGGGETRKAVLPGPFFVPGVAYDQTGGGLSADGETLVLKELPRTEPPGRSRFAVIDTGLFDRASGGPRSPGDALRTIALPGNFDFDAISPDGETLYLIEHRRPAAPSGPGPSIDYEVRSLDVASGRLDPEPVIDPSEPEERMQGLPVARAYSGDGRWAYTLYEAPGGEPFVHALDTVESTAVCVDLPQLEHVRNRYMMRLRTSEDGGALTVLESPPSLPGPARELVEIDTESFEVGPPGETATEPSGVPAWLVVAMAVGVLGAAAFYAFGRRREGPAPRTEGT